MCIKDKNKKTICPENKAGSNLINAPVALPAAIIAEVTGTSESLVKKVRSGERDGDTPAINAVKATETLWNEGSSLLLTEIKRIVNL